MVGNGNRGLRKGNLLIGQKDHIKPLRDKSNEKTGNLICLDSEVCDTWQSLRFTFSFCLYLITFQQLRLVIYIDSGTGLSYQNGKDCNALNTGVRGTQTCLQTHTKGNN